MGSPRIPLEPGGVYHIFNHAVGSDDLFREEENFLFFLRKISSRLVSFADMYAYCLMPNHFHFVLRIKERTHLDTLWKDRKNKKNLSALEFYDKLITAEFANLFNAYVQAYNRKYFRQGSLLKESFQRKRIDTTQYLIKLICYVHNNPVNHGFAKREGWKYSSFNAFMSDKNTLVLREEVLEMFGGRENFEFVHQQNLGFEP
jgi:REP element-mobilizing transposase RayT